MVFSSLIFIFYFMPLVLLFYYVIPKKHIKLRNIALLIFSLLFYFYGEPKLMIVMLLSISFNYICGLLMRCKYKKSILVLCIIINLSILGLFKYSNLLIHTTNVLFKVDIPALNIALPIGISFFTFQALSYVIDVYREEVQPQKNISQLALYVSLFPQLIAGPIVRYKDISAQLTDRSHTSDCFSGGIDRFIFGLSKKILLANTFAEIADHVFTYPPDSLSFSVAWLGAISYTLQIYFDFSGYSDMAIGLCKMFGFHLNENFNYPYISQSVTEFWRRWHISLSTWFRDYIYIPLGGNRCTPQRHLINILVVWGLTGLWHGANYTFILWGLYFGVLLIIEKYFLSAVLPKVPSFLKRICTLLLIVVGWVLFRSDSLSYAAQFIKAMSTPSMHLDNKVVEYLVRYGVLFLAGIILSTPVYQKISDKKIYRYLNIPILILLFSTCTIILLNNNYNPFIYFRF